MSDRLTPEPAHDLFNEAYESLIAASSPLRSSFELEEVGSSVAASNEVCDSAPNEAHEYLSNEAHDSPPDMVCGSPPNEVHGSPPNEVHGSPSTGDVVHDSAPSEGYESPRNVAHGSPPNFGHESSTEVAQGSAPNEVHGSPPNAAHDSFSNVVHDSVPNGTNGSLPEVAHGYAPNVGQGYPRSFVYGYAPNVANGYPHNVAHGYPRNLSQGYPSNVAPGYLPNVAQGYLPNMAQGYLPNVAQGYPPNTVHSFPQGFVHDYSPNVSQGCLPNMAQGYPRYVEGTFGPRKLVNPPQMNGTPGGYMMSDINANSVAQQSLSTSLDTMANAGSLPFTNINHDSMFQAPLEGFDLNYNLDNFPLGNFDYYGTYPAPLASSSLMSDPVGQTAREVVVDSPSGLHTPFDLPNAASSLASSSPRTIGGQGESKESPNPSFGSPSSIGTPCPSGDSPHCYDESPTSPPEAQNSPVVAYGEVSPSPGSQCAENAMDKPTYLQLQARIAELEAKENARKAQAEKEKKSLAQMAALMRSKRGSTTKPSPKQRTEPKTPPSATRKRVSKVVSDRKVIASPHQRLPPHTPGKIEMGWAPGVTREMRREIFNTPPPPLYVSPMVQEMMLARQAQIAANRKKVSKQLPSKSQDLPGNVVFHSDKASAPTAHGSSPPLLTHSPQPSQPSSQIATPASASAPSPAKAKSKARAPAKPRATAASKRATAAPKPKPSNKVTKSTKNTKSTKSTSTSTSTKRRTSPALSAAATRSVHELYGAQFGTLTHEEKCKLVLPLLQGIDPASGMQTETAPGHLAEPVADGNKDDGDVFSAIGANVFAQKEAPAQAPDQMSVADAELLNQLTEFMAKGGPEAPSFTVSDAAAAAAAAATADFTTVGLNKNVEAPLPLAGGAAEVAMVQQAAAELGPAELGGAIRQQAALQRSETRRR